MVISHSHVSLPEGTWHTIRPIRHGLWILKTLPSVSFKTPFIAWKVRKPAKPTRAKPGFFYVHAMLMDLKAVPDMICWRFLTHIPSWFWNFWRSAFSFWQLGHMAQFQAVQKDRPFGSLQWQDVLKARFGDWLHFSAPWGIKGYT